MSRETDNQAVAISKLGELTIGDCLERLETRQVAKIGPSLSVCSYVGMDPGQSHSSVKLRDKTLIRCCSTEDARKVMRLLQALEPFAKMYRRENQCLNDCDLILKLIANHSMDIEDCLPLTSTKMDYEAMYAEIEAVCQSRDKLRRRSGSPTWKRA